MSNWFKTYILHKNELTLTIIYSKEKAKLQLIMGTAMSSFLIIVNELIFCQVWFTFSCLLIFVLGGGTILKRTIQEKKKLFINKESNLILKDGETIGSCNHIKRVYVHSDFPYNENGSLNVYLVNYRNEKIKILTDNSVLDKGDVYRNNTVCLAKEISSFLNVEFKMKIERLFF